MNRLRWCDVASPIRHVVLDCTKRNILIRAMVERGAFCKVFFRQKTLEELKGFNSSAYFISNGPGDPVAMHCCSNRKRYF